MGKSTFRFPHIMYALSLVRPLAIASQILSTIVLFAYPAGFEVLYRPIANGAGTHPLTAIMILLISTGVILFKRFHKNKIAAYLAFTALLFSALRLVEIVQDISILNIFTPFSSQLNVYIREGHPISTGWNTALMVMLLSIGLLFKIRKKYVYSQFFAVIGITLPIIGLSGFAYGIDKFHGQMSISTILIAMPVAISILLSSSHRGVLQDIFNPWISGKIARLQLILVTIIPFTLGFLVVKSAHQFPSDSFGIYVVVISTLISMLVAYSAVIHERFDYQRRKMERRLARESLEDTLTLLPNRRFLFAFGNRMLTRSIRNNENLCLLMLDIDHFKHVNDTFGHQVGDEVLKHLSELVQNAIRQQDMIARYGGEEFILILPDTLLQGALQIAEKIRLVVESATFKHGKQVTISIGCAQYHDGQTLQDVISQADKGLYLAKNSGRNQVATVE